MKNLFFILAIGLTLMTFGCSSGLEIVLPDACDDVEGPSMLCEIAAEKGVTLSVVADGLGLANVIAIEKGLYTKEQALKVLAGLRSFMESPVSYAAFKTELTGVIEAYPYLLQTANKYLSQLVSSQIMYTADQELIKGWLDRLIAGLGG